MTSGVSGGLTREGRDPPRRRRAGRSRRTRARARRLGARLGPRGRRMRNRAALPRRDDSPALRRVRARTRDRGHRGRCPPGFRPRPGRPGRHLQLRWLRQLPVVSHGARVGVHFAPGAARLQRRRRLRRACKSPGRESDQAPGPRLVRDRRRPQLQRHDRRARCPAGGRRARRNRSRQRRRRRRLDGRASALGGRCACDRSGGLSG
jgi:hypothetical protein